MKLLIRRIAAPLLTVLAALGVGQAKAETVLSDLCSTVTYDLAVRLGAGIPVGVEVQGGAGWAIAFKGHALGEVKGDLGVDMGVASGAEVYVQTCISAIDLLELYTQRKLTSEQIGPVALFLGDTVRGYSTETGVEGDDDVLSGLVLAGTAAQLQAHKSSAIFEPAATMIDATLDSITGKLSPLNAVDETVGSMRGLVDAMPIDPRMANYIRNIDNLLADQVVAMVDSSDVICDAVGGSEALTSFCNDLTSFAENTAALQEVVQGVLGVIGEVGGSIEETAVVFDGVVVATEAIDGVMGDSIGAMGDVVGFVGDSTRSVVGLTSGVSGSINTMTEALDDIATVTNKTIGTVMSAVAAPVKVLAEVGKGAIDGVLTTLGFINDKVEELANILRI